ncbi:hypothetical protein Pmani_013242 [Petrolisthes manimaculis]|uniref:Uncharacterized protein n=1 Tax=Petrolisthes manimaculis TaxID=1843537 RepID=A0AAE1PWX7_9EUCA|nr:hypothetical protein Pmani_013242 [Petrolisthes manimaculis]
MQKRKENAFMTLSPDYEYVGPKGRTTLVAASIEKQDGLHEVIQIQEPLTLHIECRKAYTRESSIRSAKRKPENTVADDNDECQYTVCDLMERMETFLNGEEGFSLKYFKQKLKDRYKDDIIITTIHGKASLVSFRESAHRILLLLAIAVFIHRKYTSSELIDILSSISFANDYKEVQRFENSLISAGKPSYGLQWFTQFVFDNADFNIATLTGHKTFHTMDGIDCVTPPGTVDKSPVNCTMQILPAEVVGTLGKYPSRHTASL